MNKNNLKTVYSHILRQEVCFWYYIPEAPRGLLYLMHGNRGRCTDWAEHTDIGALAEQYGLAVVAPDFADSYCTDTADGRPWFHYLTRELPDLAAEAVGRRFSPAENYICGLSAGGYGALKWAFACPGSFVACAALSAVTDMAARIALLPAERLDSFRPIFGQELTVSPENDLPRLTREADSRRKEMPVFLACGTGDSFLEMNNAYHRLLTQLEVPHTYRTGPGGHRWEFWRQWLPTALAWMTEQR